MLVMLIILHSFSLYNLFHLWHYCLLMKQICVIYLLFLTSLPLYSIFLTSKSSISLIYLNTFENRQKGKNMNAFEIKKIADNPQLADMAANWFHLKWKIPLKAYQESMQECVKQTNAIPQWYVILDNNHIIAGLGVIENDFHNRKDLTPNICAVYVEKSYRGQGIAGNMLNFVCEDMKKIGIHTLYLVTDHTSFYERYNWQFFCMVQGDGEQTKSRMYIHHL